MSPVIRGGRGGREVDGENQVWYIWHIVNATIYPHPDNNKKRLQKKIEIHTENT
jgi:hypothetical protein